VDQSGLIAPATNETHMKNTWWVGESQLDNDQKAVVKLPPDGSRLVLGPPGSGKTNLLLLRADYLYLGGRRDILIVTFTRNLCDFIAAGGVQYDFPIEKIVTCESWKRDLLVQYGRSFRPPDGTFEDRRNYMTEQVSNLVDTKGLANLYDAVLLDEAQDYLPEEIEMFHKLAKAIFCVADSRQKIYGGADSIETLTRLIGSPASVLEYHYRNAPPICKIADALAKDGDGHVPLLPKCNYKDIDSPPRVEHFNCDSLESQASRIIEQLDSQREAYPEELLGIVCPRKNQTQLLYDLVSQSPLGQHAMLLMGIEGERFDATKEICVCTFHAVKGLEFRALHMAGCDLLWGMPLNRNLTYTAVTRAKTSLSVYYSGKIYGYFESALASIEPPPRLPAVKDLFGGNS